MKIESSTGARFLLRLIPKSLHAALLNQLIFKKENHMNILKAIWAFLAGIIAKFGPQMKPIIKTGEDIYDNLNGYAQQGAQWASGIIAIVNQNIDATPPVIKNLIAEKFPDLSLDVVHGFLDTAMAKLNKGRTSIPLTLEDAIAEVQGFLKPHENDPTVWGIVSKGLYTFLAVLFSPDTAAQELEAAGEYVYHLIVKPHVEGTAELPPTKAPDTTASIPSQPAGVDEVPAPTPEPPATTDDTKATDQQGTDQSPATDPDMQIVNETRESLGGGDDNSKIGEGLEKGADGRFITPGGQPTGPASDI